MGTLERRGLVRFANGDGFTDAEKGSGFDTLTGGGSNATGSGFGCMMCFNSSSVLEG